MIESEEFIGKKAEIHWNKKIFQGTIIDETKNTLMIRTASGDKKILKNTSKIIINNQIIQGETITRRPEDRIKK
jgi:RNase P/RNase MRP subunit p29